MENQATEHTVLVRLRIQKLSLVAMATVFELALFVLDSVIPKPFPWIKVGLANIVTLALLVTVGWRLAASVHFLRIVLGAVFMGGLFTPFFLLSFSGGAVSFLAMAILVNWAMPVLGFLGVSFLGALTHNLTQLVLVATVISDKTLIFVLWPVVVLLSTLYGCFSGFSSYHFCHRVPQLVSGKWAVTSGSSGNDLN